MDMLSSSDDEEMHQGRPLWLVKWPDSTLSLVSAFSHSGLLAILDEISDTSRCTWIPYVGQVYVPLKFVSKPIQRRGFQSCDTQASLLRDMRMMMNCDEFKDFSLISSDGREIKAHKCIVLSRCASFKKLLSQSTDPAKLVLHDISYGVLVRVVEFLYTGEANMTTDDSGYDPTFALNLLEVSSSYELEELKQLSQQHLVNLIDCNGGRMEIKGLMACCEVAQKCKAVHLSLPPLQHLASIAHEEQSYENIIAQFNSDFDAKQCIIQFDSIRSKMGMQPIEHVRVQKKMFAIIHSSTDCTQGLEQYTKAQLNNCCVLHYACMNCTVATVTYVMQLGVEINQADDNGSTPLHVCATKEDMDGSHVRLIQLLLEAGGNVHCTNKTGKTPVAVSKAQIQDSKAFHVSIHGNLHGWDRGVGQRFEKVLKVLQAAEQRDQERQDAAIRTKDAAKSKLDEKDYASAVSLYEEAAKNSPVPLTQAQCVGNLSLVLLKMGKLAAALKAADSALLLDAGYAKAHYRRAQALLQLGREAEAKEATARSKEKTQEKKKIAKVPLEQEFVDDEGVGVRPSDEAPDWLKVTFGDIEEHGCIHGEMAKAVCKLALPRSSMKYEELQTYLDKRCVEGSSFYGDSEGAVMDSVHGEQTARELVLANAFPPEVRDKISSFSARVGMVNALKAAVAEDFFSGSTPLGAFDCTTAPLNDGAGGAEDGGGFDY